MNDWKDRISQKLKRTEEPAMDQQTTRLSGRITEIMPENPDSAASAEKGEITGAGSAGAVGKDAGAGTD